MRVSCTALLSILCLSIVLMVVTCSDTVLSASASRFFNSISSISSNDMLFSALLLSTSDAINNSSLLSALLVISAILALSFLFSDTKSCIASPHSSISFSSSWMSHSSLVLLFVISSIRLFSSFSCFCSTLISFSANSLSNITSSTCCAR